ncbi:MAG: FAD-dependent oxidoreductase [Candidatus Cloacimonetes bacterium]|nr:FAD-dependent oxidoreductase [Candidatus Cloacimonadota bacterium]
MRSDGKKNFTGKIALEEASRCLLCYDAPCSKACPAGTNPEKFIRSLRLKNIKGAIETVREANILGGSCALVCEYDRLCEEACSRTGIDKPIDIGGLQRFIVEQEKCFEMKVLQKKRNTDIKVACVGAGPASLACAAYLAVEGINVTIFDKNSEPGGILTYGICSSRLPREVVDFDLSHLKRLGVKFAMNKWWGVDFSISELHKEGFEAIFVGIGLWKAKLLEIPGIDSENVFNALNFLYEVRTQNITSLRNKHVVVLGGGDVAMDCAVSAKESKAESVTVVYRRSLLESPACYEQKRSIQLKGINFISNFSPNEIVSKDNKVKYLIATGRDNVSLLKLRADVIIYAIGQTVERNFDEDTEFVEELMQGNDLTNRGIFAGGDLINGGKSVVQAVADGKDSGKAIIKYLSDKGRC